MSDKQLLFSIVRDTDTSIYLHVGDTLIIPFKDMEEWEKFANNMLDMTAEIRENLESGNY